MRTKCRQHKNIIKFEVAQFKMQVDHNKIEESKCLNMNKDQLN